MHSDRIRPVPALRLVGDHAAALPAAARQSGQAVLRLVNPSESGPANRTPSQLPSRPADRTAVEHETRSAAQLSALDARWILAVQVSKDLAGGRAAILTPECRQRLMTLGHRFGLRPFDTSLVIAIVQDAARSGDDELGRPVVERLHLVRPGPDLFPQRRAQWADVLKHAALIVAAAALVAFAMVRWITA